MISGYFRLDDDDFKRPYIDLDVEFHAPLNVRMNATFMVDTGADRTLLSPVIAQRLYDQFDFDVGTLDTGPPLRGIGGQANTRRIDVTMRQGSFWIAMPVLIIDAVPGPNSAPSLLGRDMLDDFALFMERRSERVLLLDAGEADDFVNLPATGRR